MRAALTVFLLGAAVAHAAEDVPFVTTPDNVTRAMLDLAKVTSGDYVIDLGSGDGRIVIEAARRGARGLGVEIDPRLVAESEAHARKAGVSSRAFFREMDLYKTDLTPASIITMYLLPEVNLQLRPKLLRLRPGTRVVSHDWDMGDWKPDRTITLAVPDKAIGLEKSSKVHLWIVPARVDGRWCGTSRKAKAELRLAQDYQSLKGEIAFDDQPGTAISGKIRGRDLNFGSFTARAEGEDAMRVAARGALAPAAGMFKRCRR